MPQTMELTAPLFAAWSEQYVKLKLPATAPGTPLALTVNGTPTAFQYTGGSSADDAAEILMRLRFAAGETKHLEFAEGRPGTTDLTRHELALDRDVVIGPGERPLTIPKPVRHDGLVCGPLGGFAGFPFRSGIRCRADFDGATLVRTNTGPLFEDYELEYAFADHRTYRISFRCYHDEPLVEVAERYGLRLGAELVWTINPARRFTHILSRESFEKENQPQIEPLIKDRPRDLLCRLQMPVLSEYFIPNNRGWFAVFNDDNHDQPMLGVLGLYGDRWQQPVEGMPKLYGRDGAVAWQASLESGARYWLLYTGPLETRHRPDRRLVFHRLHAEFNALRLTDHLDLTGQDVYHGALENAGFYGPADFRQRARKRVDALPPLQAIAADFEAGAKRHNGAYLVSLKALLEPSTTNNAAVKEMLLRRFDKWVRQFQGWRTGDSDYSKNVIGFSRKLRGLLLGYELLRRNDALSADEIGRLNAYFVFAARRICDEGRWPHSRTALHPDHPESTRDLYTYGGEHKPDRLYWTNCLPNFQSDPLCALAHLAALFREHPDSDQWLRLALTDLEHQLDAYCGAGGAWVESINYALYTVSYFVITFKALKEHLGIDYFHDERVRRLLHWLVRYFGPRDKRWQKHTWPGVGNARCPTAGGEYLLCFAGELDPEDPLRAELIAVYQRLEGNQLPAEHYPLVMAAMAPIPDREYDLQPLSSEVMDEVGVALRHDHLKANESYLFQKIGFAKDHYEADETAFNWYAKGTPFTMDYGTYTKDVAIGAAHNAIDIPDLDPLRRGYLADHIFTNAVDYTHCEMPVTLKLLWDQVRGFAEVDGRDGVVHRDNTTYYYIGDDNPVGPKTWKTRLLLFAKPDYVVLFDRVYGDVPHRYCLHFTGDRLERDGAELRGRGRFDLDLLGYVQHPPAFESETGELIPDLNGNGSPDADRPHGQHWFRIYNRRDGIYRTLLFAKERQREVRIGRIGHTGMRVTTPEYTDTVFIGNEYIEEDLDAVRFAGKTAWLRQTADSIQAVMVDGDRLQASGVELTGRGPWAYNLDGAGGVTQLGGPPREIRLEGQCIVP